MITYEEDVDNENFNVSNHSEPDQILNIKSNLLKPAERLKVGNRLLDDIKYERAGGSGVFEALPNVVKFQGFELNKKQTIKLLLVNKSKFSQRIALIPPTTPFFKIKFTKRGLIAPGLSEIVYVTFIPENFQYYYDYIRVICEGDKMMIPIHAYPKMNIHMVEYIPRFIDFGVVAINSKGTKEIPLRNIITLPFEFEFVPFKTCEEIKIEPLYGEIESVSNKTIIFTFSPQSYGLFISEYEFKLSEFEYKTFTITITGNCNVFDKVLNENILIHMKKQREKNSIMKSNMEDCNSNKTRTKSLMKINSNLNSQKVSQYTKNSPKNGMMTPTSRQQNESMINKQFNQISIDNISRKSNTNTVANSNIVKNKQINYNINEETENAESLIASGKTNQNNLNINEDNLSNHPNNNQMYSPSSSQAFKKMENINEEENTQSYLKNDNFDENNTKSQLSLRNNNVSMLSLSNRQGSFNKKFKSFPSTKEREFLQYYNQIESTIKDKDIKYIKFIGKKLLTDEQINKFVSERIKDFEDNLLLKRNIDINRFKFEFDTAKCTVDRLNRYYLKPTFNFNYNDKFFKTRHYFKIFLRWMTKVVIRKRAEKNMNNLNKMLNQQNIKNPKEFADYAEKDWIQQLTKDQETQESKMKIKFIKPRTFLRSPTYLCYDYNLESLKQEINHENNINLEELYQYNKFDPNDIEIYGYKELRSTGLTLYEVSTDDKILRSGAENENPIRGERGDSEQSIEKIMNLLEMPKSYKYHIETKIDTLLFHNPSLKKYCQYPEYNECSLDYNLQPRFIDTSDYFKNLSNAGFNYQNDIYNKLPLTIYENIQMRELEKNLICDSSMDFMQKKLSSSDERELFIKNHEKVDEDNYIIDIPREDELNTQENIEKDDEVILKIRESQKDEVVDPKDKEKANLENYLQSQKRKWISTLPTVIEFYNSGMTYSNNKFIL